MSQYTIVNIFSSHLEEINRRVTLSGYQRLNSECLFIRQGGHNKEEIMNTLFGKSGKLIYDIPIYLPVEEKSQYALVLIDEMEDTGNTHETELYEVEAFEGATKIDEKTIHDTVSAKETEEYYRTQHEVDPKVNF